jgi:phosphoserine phosphatase
MKGLAALDMDGTILQNRTIDVLCDAFDLNRELNEIDKVSHNLKAYEVSRRIAKLFSGVKQSKVEALFDTIPLVPGIHEFITLLKSSEYVSTIITDSYTFLAHRLAQKIGVDVVKGNDMEILDGVITGKLTMPLGWHQEKKENCRQAAICKLHAMHELVLEYSIRNNQTLAIGDSISDLCMIRKARIGVAFRPKSPSLGQWADVVIHTDFYDLANWMKKRIFNTSNNKKRKRNVHQEK